MATRIKLRRGTDAQWTAENPILAAGEPGYVTDTGELKVGDGTTAWNSLPTFVDEQAASATFITPAELTTALAGIESGAAFIVTTYGAVGDVQIVSDAAMTSSSAVLTSATAGFETADVGKVIAVPGAGAAGAALVTTIASRQSATQVTLTATASTTVSGKRAQWGTDSTAAIQAAADAAFAAGGGTVLVPRGNYYANFTIGSKVVVQGEGQASRITAKPGTSTAVIGTVQAANSYFYAVNYLQVDGNRERGCTGRGIDFQGSNDYYSTDVLAADMAPWIDNVLVVFSGSDGIRLGQRESRLTNFYILGCERGLYIDQTDCRITTGTVGGSSTHGVEVVQSNNILTAVKCFYSGRNVLGSAWNATGSGDAFRVSASNTQLTGCQGQDNNGATLNIRTGGDRTFAQGLVSAGDRYGFLVIQAASKCTVSGQMIDGSPESTLTDTTVAVSLIGAGATNNKVDVAVRVATALTTRVDLQSSASLVGNELRFEGDTLGTTTGGTLTPDQYVSRTYAGTLTSNLTVNAPLLPFAGQRLDFILTQDGTGGRTITFAADYTTAFTANTAAGATTTVGFVYDGTKWRQVSTNSPTASSSSGGGLLALTQYTPGSYTAMATTSTTFVDLDATNAVVTFTAPASGKVLVRLTARVKAPVGTVPYFNLRDSGGDVAGTSRFTHDGDASSRYLYVSLPIHVTGLTSGNSYTWKWGWASSSGSTVNVERGAGPPSIPLTMEVWAA